jgi:hypothetical protein
VISTSGGEEHHLALGRGLIGVAMKPPLIKGEVVEGEYGVVLVNIVVPAAYQLYQSISDGELMTYPYMASSQRAI